LTGEAEYTRVRALPTPAHRGARVTTRVVSAMSL
jgi:hypothetical protein